VQITDYQFGRIEIDGEIYRSDVIVSPENVVAGWWRRSGHNLTIADLDAVLNTRPDTLVIGCGYFGRMQVPAATRSFLEGKGIRVEVGTTTDAVRRFNRLQQQAARVVAALHLTC
jgi:hypothetical protein